MTAPEAQQPGAKPLCCVRRRDLGRLRGGSDASDSDLLQQAQEVPLPPALYDAAAFNAGDMHLRHGHCLARGRMAAELARVRAAHRDPVDDLVGVGEDVFGRLFRSGKALRKTCRVSR